MSISARTFDPSTYWEERLRKNSGITGVGYTSLGRYFNQWQYRIRRQVFLRLINSLNVEWKSFSVLDIGSGTGFYIDLWKHLRVNSIKGSDLTEIAVSRLRKQFPELNFSQLDIGDSHLALLSQHFDVVSAFDVLFHIVDDSRYRQAVENVHTLLNPGGLFFFSDILPSGPTQRSIHMVSRSRHEVETLLGATGFEIIRRVPMFILMNQPIDTKSKTRAFLWRLFVYVTRNSEPLGWLFGAVLYPLELMLTAVFKETPSAKVLVCRKVAASVGCK